MTLPMTDLNPAGVEAAWLAGGIALHEHAPDIGKISRTAIVQVVVDAALPAYIASLPQPEGETAELVAWLGRTDGDENGFIPTSVELRHRIRDAITSLSQRLVDRAEAAEARLAVVEAERDEWRSMATADIDALQQIGEDFGVLGGEPRVSGIRRILTEQRADVLNFGNQLQAAAIELASICDALGIDRETVDVAEAAEAQIATICTEVGVERTPDVAMAVHFYRRGAEAQLAHAREAAIEECAKVADECRTDIERNPHDFGNLDAGGIRASDKIAAAIRAMKGG